MRIVTRLMGELRGRKGIINLKEFEHRQVIRPAVTHRFFRVQLVDSMRERSQVLVVVQFEWWGGRKTFHALAY